MSAELIAYLAERRVGRLVRKDNGNLQFRYDDGYDGPPLSHAMPVQAEAHPHAVCHAVFGGLLPEGDGREALARVLGVSPGNDYGLLAEVGGDCAGAISLLEPAAPLAVGPQTRMLDDDQLDAVLRALPQRPLGAAPEEGVRLSLAGAQPKLPVVIRTAASRCRSTRRRPRRTSSSPSRRASPVSWRTRRSACGSPEPRRCPSQRSRWRRPSRGFRT